jgi:hypothetical protein
LEEEAQDDACSLVQETLSSAFEQLQASALSWLAACERLDEYTRIDLLEEEEQRERDVLRLLADSYEHLLFVACLSVRLVRQIHAALDEPMRTVLCPLAVLDQEVRP